MMNPSCSTPRSTPGQALVSIALSAGFDDAALLRADVFGLPGDRLLLILVRQYIPWRELPPEEGIGRVSAYYPVSHATGQRMSALTETLRLKGYDPIPNPDIPLKTAACRVGLGLPGRHTLLLHPQFGSFCHLRAILVGNIPVLPLEPTAPAVETPLHPHCRHCRLCVSACPTGAIREDGTLDRERCLRHVMAGHLPEQLPQAFALLAAMDSRLLGCDTCQVVCPVNRPLIARADPVPEPYRRLFSLAEILEADKEAYSAFLAEAGALLGKNLIRPRRMKIQAAVAAANLVRDRAGARGGEHYPALIARVLKDPLIRDLPPVWKDYLAAYASMP